MASDPPPIKLRFYVDREMAVAWTYHVVDGQERIMDVGLVCQSSNEILRLGHDGVSACGFPYEWQRKTIQL